MRHNYWTILFILSLFFASCKNITIPEEGVSQQLATKRAAVISNIKYNIFFSIPKERESRIVGHVDVEVELNKKCDLILDFRADSASVISASINNKPIDYEFVNGHIVIPRKYVQKGTNRFEIEFIAGNSSLNRKDDFLYTLLVPDRASTVFPCFDQPDLKAIFNLSLEIPTKWTAVANGAVKEKKQVSDSTLKFIFKPTLPISTYLFAFAVGEFKQVSRTVDGRTFNIFHRETDSVKFNRNVDILFNSHAAALSWLEDYSGIPYPFGKLDFVLIPGFQYSGMEHAGAIFYRDSRLLLDENPTQTQKLQQANLIAHEVAHQWFGNLVTMRWFNDVWLKEVFAGYMADMIVNPQHPDINHNLNFLLSHFPRAYSVDRTQGANPIVQDLENLLFAGTLYGDIIYHKAPIMMQQLVMLMGEEEFRDGVREYLSKFAMGNANWSELIDILDKYTEHDLNEWVLVWANSVGRPTIQFSETETKNDSITIKIESVSDCSVPNMNISLSSLHTNDSHINVLIENLPKSVTVAKKFFSSKVLYNSTGTGYGCFIPDSLNLSFFLINPSAIENSVARASFVISVYEMFLEGKLTTEDYLKFLIEVYEGEEESQIQEFLLASLKTVWWNFLNNELRKKHGETVESILKNSANGSKPVEQKRSAFSALVAVFTSKEMAGELHKAWEKGEFCGLKLNENELTNLSFELLVRMPEKFEQVVNTQRKRISNPDRLERFNFVAPALSPNEEKRSALFEKLKDANNRRPEPTALEAIKYLHHPLRSDFSISILEQSLDLLPEIQRTGDIFFPKSWLDAVLSGHSSPEAKMVVEQWIDSHPELSPNLKAKLQQSADMIYRVNSE